MLASDSQQLQSFIPMKQGSDQVLKAIRQQQKRLLLLRHASECKIGVNCATKFCSQMTTLWKHMKKCRDKNCKISHCLSSRCVLIHYRICRSQGRTATCEVCGPVMEQIKRQDASEGMDGSVDPLAAKLDSQPIQQLQNAQQKLHQQQQVLKQLQKQLAQLLEQHRQLREQRQRGQQLQQALLQALQQHQASLSLNRARTVTPDNLQLSRIQSQPTQYQGHVGSKINQIDDDTPHLQDLDDFLSGNQDPLQQALDRASLKGGINHGDEIAPNLHSQESPPTDGDLGINDEASTQSNTDAVEPHKPAACR
jgi:myosin heavy subunit